MPDTEVSVLTPEELFEMAKLCATDPASIVDHLHGGGTFSWDWAIDESDQAQGKVRVCVMADSDNVVGYAAGTAWIRPHTLILLQCFPDGSTGEKLELTFRPDTPLGIEKGLPRTTLATLLARQPLPSTA